MDRGVWKSLYVMWKVPLYNNPTDDYHSEVIVLVLWPVHYWFGSLLLLHVTFWPLEIWVTESFSPVKFRLFFYEEDKILFIAPLE